MTIGFPQFTAQPAPPEVVAPPSESRDAPTESHKPFDETLANADRAVSRKKDADEPKEIEHVAEDPAPTDADETESEVVAADDEGVVETDDEQAIVDLVVAEVEQLAGQVAPDQGDGLDVSELTNAGQLPVDGESVVKTDAPVQVAETPQVPLEFQAPVVAGGDTVTNLSNGAELSNDTGDSSSSHGQSSQQLPDAPGQSQVIGSARSANVLSQVFDVASAPSHAVQTQIDSVSQNTAPPPPLPAAPTAPVETSEDSANVARVARGLQSALNQRGGVVTLRLQPPEMGLVRVRMTMSEGAVRVQISAENDGVKTLLNRQLSQLRYALQGHGLNVEQLDVQSPQSNSHASFDHESEDGRSRGEYARQHGDAPESNDEEEKEFEQELTNTMA